MKKLCVIGVGNMGGALLSGFLKSGGLSSGMLTAYDKDTEKMDRKAAEMGFMPATTLRAGVQSADALLIACKPDKVEGVIGEIRDLLPGKMLLSIALGWDHARYAAILPEGVRVQFIMPNTPALVGSGVFLFEETISLTATELTEVKALFAALGKVFVLPSAQMGVGGAITGCGPAFVDLMIEAFADAGVYYGLPRDKALAMVSATIEGSARLQKETGTHPGVLKDMVCSPGGSTIRGVVALEDAGFRAACISAIREIMK